MELKYLLCETVDGIATVTVNRPEKMNALNAAVLGELACCFDALKAELSKAALSRFGSGWAWLVLTPGGELAVTSTPNQDSPLSDGHVPVVGIDVWEHAYYLSYRNRRAEWVEAFFRLVDWETAGRIYEAAVK